MTYAGRLVTHTRHSGVKGAAIYMPRERQHPKSHNFLIVATRTSANEPIRVYLSVCLIVVVLVCLFAV